MYLFEGKGRNHAIYTYRTLIERSIQTQKDPHFCFLDYNKAFDKAKYDEVIKMLEYINSDGKIPEYYKKCLLFSPYSEKIMRQIKVRQGTQAGVYTNNLRY